MWFNTTKIQRSWQMRTSWSDPSQNNFSSPARDSIQHRFLLFLVKVLEKVGQKSFRCLEMSRYISALSFPYLLLGISSSETRTYVSSHSQTKLYPLSNFSDEGKISKVACTGKTLKKYYRGTRRGCVFVPDVFGKWTALMWRWTL